MSNYIKQKHCLIFFIYKCLCKWSSLEIIQGERNILKIHSKVSITIIVTFLGINVLSLTSRENNDFMNE